MESDRVPKIISFVCNWCSYDELGSDDDTKVIRVMCGGRVDPVEVFRALKGGADGVFVAGCPEDGCRYIEGNKKMMGRMERVSRALEYLGLDGRLRVIKATPNDAVKLPEMMNVFRERLKKLGQSQLKNGEF